MLRGRAHCEASGWTTWCLQALTAGAALGRAQVTLVIDNESRTLPTQTAEVAITRTLFRSGESEYALNGTPCRLLDLQELLNDAGVGRQQHIIVAQGQIEQVLAARPEERRALIEEAAGRTEVPSPQGTGRAAVGRHRGKCDAPRRSAA